MKKVNTTVCKSHCTKASAWWSHMHGRAEEISETKCKNGGGKATKTSGGDPAFSAAQKIRGVAPALRHRVRCP